MLSEDKKTVPSASADSICQVDDGSTPKKAGNPPFIKYIPLAHRGEESPSLERHSHFLKSFIEKMVKMTGLTTHKTAKVTAPHPIHDADSSLGLPHSSLPPLKYLTAEESAATAILQRWALNSGEAPHEELPTTTALLLFALDKYPKELEEQLSLENRDALHSWLSSCFSHHLANIRSSVALHYQRHKKTGLQPSSVAARVAMASEIAKLLATRFGTINHEILPLLIETLHQEQPPSFPHEAEILRDITKKLSYLQDNEPLCQTLISSTVAANTLPPLAKIVVRSSLGLPPQLPISREHVVATLLTALLSHIRQGTAGSCFATSLAINMLAVAPEQCLHDFLALLHDNAITRHVDNIEMQFPYLLSTATTALNQQVTINREGELLLPGNQLSMLWEAPGLHAAATALGISDLQELFKKWIDERWLPLPPEQQRLTLPLRTIFEALADHAHAYQSLSLPPQQQQQLRSELYAQGLFTFEAQISNPLLKAWENAIASMAEAHDSGLVRSAVLNTTVDVMMEEVRRRSLLPRSLQHTLASDLHQELGQSIRIQYDPCIDHDTSAKHPRFVQGAFVLYHQHHWQRLDTPSAYQSLCTSIWQQTLYKLLPHATGSVTKELEELLLPLIDYINSNHFLLNVVRRFNHRNMALDPALTQLDTLKHTPWITRIGNNPKKVLEVYLENSHNIKYEKFTPITAERLLTKIIAMGRQKRHTTPSTTNPYLLMPVRTPGLHSFSLLLKHPSLANGCASSCEPASWISQRLILPGLELANSLIEEDCRQRIFEYISEQLLAHEYNPSFLHETKTFPKRLSISLFRNKVLELLNKIAPLPPLATAQRTRHLDTALCHLLPPTQKSLFENQAIHFADTNWYKGIHDIHLCFVFNPGSRQLEIWEVCDDGSHLLAVDQNLWLHQQEWEFYNFSSNSLTS